MKKLIRLGLCLSIAMLPLLNSCEKETIVKSNDPTNPTVGDDQNQEKAQVKFINAIDPSIAGAISIKIGGIDIVEGLPLKEITDFIPVNIGELQIEVLGTKNNVLLSTTLTLLEDQVYNVVLSTQANGLTDLDLLQSLPANLGILSDPLGYVLGLDLVPADLSTLNFLNLSDIQDGNLLMALDLLNADGDIVGGLLEIPTGLLSDPMLLNGDILGNLDFVNSTLPIDDLLGNLLGGNDLLEIVDLGSITGLLNLGSSGSGGILSTISGLLDGLLGGILPGLGGDNPLSLLDGDILSGLPLDVPGNYTLIILGDEQHLDYILVDNKLLGIPVPVLQ
jgi:hypothetical protein